MDSNLEDGLFVQHSEGKDTLYLGEVRVDLGEDTLYLGEETLYLGEDSLYLGEDTLYLGEDIGEDTLSWIMKSRVLPKRNGQEKTPWPKEKMKKAYISHKIELPAGMRNKLIFLYYNTNCNI